MQQPLSSTTATDERSAVQAALPRLGFGPFVLDGPGGRLLRDSVPLDIAPRPFALLAHLATRPGLLVSKDELLDAVWGHRFVSDSALKVAINTLRAVLAEDAKAPRWIQTVARRGYRFASDVQVVRGEVLPPPPDRPARAAAPTAEGLFGRADEQAALQTLLAAGERLVTLVGPGGVGKTRLAQAVDGHAAPPDGVHWLRLDALAEPAQVAPALARCLALGAEAGNSTQALGRALSPLRVRVVLDNAEHLLGLPGDLAAQVAQWTLAAPGVQWLLTSQRALRVVGERLLPVAPLPLPPDPQAAGPASAQQLMDNPAVALFVARVAALQPGWRADLTALHDVAAVVRALDGLPLQLELAAARVPLLGTAGVRQRLDERLRLLARGRSDAPGRHQTLRAALDWSVSLLSDPARRLLARLSVFAGGFSAAAAQAVADADPWAVLDDLDNLRELGLVQVHDDGGEPRLRLFDSVRLHGAEALAADGSTDATRDAHLAWMLATFTAADARLFDSGEDVWLRPLSPEAENLQAAMAHALHKAQAGADAAAAAGAIRLLASSVRFCLSVGLKRVALGWLQGLQALPLAVETLPPPLQADLLAAGALLGALGQTLPPQQALAAAQVAVAALDAVGERRRALYLQYHIGMLHSRLHQADAGAAALVAFNARLPADATVYERRLSAWLAACLARDAGDAEAYRAFWADMLAQSRALGDRIEGWRAAWGLGQALMLQGDDAGAMQVLDHAVHDIRAAGRLRAFAALAAQAALLHAATDATPDTLARVREAVRLLQGDGQVWWLADALPWLALHQGRVADAGRLMAWADALVQQRGEARGPVFARLRHSFALRWDALGMATPGGSGGLNDEATALALAGL